MARRFAVVVGVRKYRSFSPLAAAQLDAEMMAHVLREIAGFDDVRLFLDPDQLQLAEAIESLFAGRERDDLTLFYFSGHGIKDERGYLHFGVPNTRKRANGELVRSSAVPCRHVHDAMAVSRARRQVVILDCCFSAAFAEGMSAKDAGNLGLRAQLGGQGRAVLASSSSTEFSFDTSETGMSMYTQYLVHGISTGEADLNHDGKITADELHEYAKARVRAEKPTMSPQILPSREGYSIVIAPARQVDPRRAYAAKVREVADASGSISKVAARVLALHQQQLGIAPDDARQIEEAELGSRRSRVSSVNLLREAVYDARSRGRVDRERVLLNELRVASNLTETDLSDLLQEPID
ncbi:MAG TPA: caspase family protein, partial [Nannocystis exedens]|nr:caspase family protein [Nannocystis exedens]